MIFRFKNVDIPKEAYDYVDSNSVTKVIRYIIDSKFRTSVALQHWAEAFVSGADPHIIKKAESLIGTTHDRTMINILKYVRSIVTYTPDSKQWNMSEYWQVPEKTYAEGKGDCEDGAILIYTLGILAGVPESRLKIMCGWVKTTGGKGGHAWCAYKPDQYPLNWVFLDWCYWYLGNQPKNRDIFYIKGKQIYEYRYIPNQIEHLKIKKDVQRYKELWFAFDHKKSMDGIWQKR